MKFRSAFVSNSSSSSFVLIGSIVAEGSDIVNIKLSNFNLDNLMCVGGSLSEGLDVFDFTDEHIKVMKRKLQTSPDFFDDITLYDVSFFSCDYSSNSLNRDDLKEDCVYEVIYGYADYHSSDDASKLIENVESYDKY